MLPYGLPSPSMKAFDRLGHAVRLLRRQRGLTQEQLAAAAGIGTRTLVNLESGVKSPGVDTLDAVLTALGATLDELVTELKRAQGYAAAPEPTAEEIREAEHLAPNAGDDAVLELVTRSLETQQQLLAALVRRKRS